MTKRSKYGNVKVEVFGIKFDSIKESNRFLKLRQMQKEGKISKLELQPRFDCDVNGVRVCFYKADFSYFTENRFVVEDVKSAFTAKNREFRLKKKLVEALHPGITIEVVI